MSGDGAPGGTRTHDLQVRNLTLYPLSYGRNPRANGLDGARPGPRRKLAEREGFEPSEQVTPLNGLANRRTRPLCDLSVARRPESYHGGAAPRPLPGLVRWPALRMPEGAHDQRRERPGISRETDERSG